VSAYHQYMRLLSSMVHRRQQHAADDDEGEDRVNDRLDVLWYRLTEIEQERVDAWVAHHNRQQAPETREVVFSADAELAAYEQALGELGDVTLTGNVRLSRDLEVRGNLDIGEHTLSSNGHRVIVRGTLSGGPGAAVVPTASRRPL
jgi:hypothetical protein